MIFPRFSNFTPALLAMLFVLGGCNSTDFFNLGQTDSTPTNQTNTRLDEPLQRTSPAGSFLAATHANRSNDFAAATQFIEKNLIFDDSNQNLLVQKLALQIINGEIESSFTIADQLLEQSEQISIAHTIKAIEFAALNEFALAEKQWRNIDKVHSGQFIRPLVLAWAQAGQYNFEGAFKSLDDLKKISSFEGLMHFHAALLSDFQGETEKAVEYLNQAEEEVALINIRYVEVAVEIYKKAGQPEKARQLVDALLLQEPTTIFRQMLEQKLQAPPMTEPVVTVKEGIAQGLYDVATIFASENRPRQGLFYGQLAHYIDPDFAILNLFIARVFRQLENYEKANQTLASATFTPPFQWMADLQRAENLFRMGNHKEATALLEKMEQQHPERTDTLTLHGDVLRDEGRYQEAAEYYSKAINLMDGENPSAWSVYYARGIAYERADMWDKAEADLQTALELEPTQPYVLNYLGYSWIEKGINVEKAKNYIVKAVTLRPNDGYIIDSLGWALYRLGEYDNAVKYLERAVELRPHDPVIVDHLGDAYWRVGRKNEARFLWQQALAFKPEEDLRRKIENKLQSGLSADQKS